MEDDGKPYTINLSNYCYNLSHSGRTDPDFSGKRWRIMVGEKSSPCILSGCLGAKGFENNLCGTPRNRTVVCRTRRQRCSWGKRWSDESPYTEELALLREGDGVHLAGTLVRLAMTAGEEDDWSEFTSSTKGACSLKGASRSRSRPITAILPGSKWSCFLLRTVLQDALSEVMKVNPLLKPKVFVDDLTASWVEETHFAPRAHKWSR